MHTKGKGPSEGAAPNEPSRPGLNGLARSRNGSVEQKALRADGTRRVASTREGGNVMEMQRRRLLLAIGEVVGEDGLEGASIGRICKRAGMSRRTFYEIFEDREACFLVASKTAIERIADRVLPAYRGERRWREGVRAALAALLDRFDTDPGLARLCLVEMLKAGPEVLEYRRRVLEGLSAAVDEGRREAKHGAGPARLTAESIVGGVLSVLHARVLARMSPATMRLSPATVSLSLPTVSPSPATVSLRTEGFDRRPLMELLNPLMSMIVHPYLGPAAAKRESEQPLLPPNARAAAVAASAGSDPFRDLPIRFTYRTARVLATIAAEPGINNREVGDIAGVHDQGQISKLLQRLQRNGLIVNQQLEKARGEPNAWRLTERGRAIHTAIDTQAHI